MDNAVNNKHHILIVCNNPLVLAEVKQELRGNFSVGLAASCEATISSLEVTDTSAIVICIGDNRKEAFAMFTGIFEAVKSKHIPVIFLAEKGNDDDETAAFEMGAVDYSARRQGTAGALVNRIRLRIQASEVERLISSEKPQSSSNETPESILEGKTILVAEDIDLNREVVNAILADIKGLTVEFAFEGKEAFDKFSESPDKYSLILMDVQMPVMDGLESTRAIRAIKSQQSKSIPIIALTGGVQDEEIALCLKAGMNDFIEKPFDFNNLLAVVSKHCL